MAGYRLYLLDKHAHIVQAHTAYCDSAEEVQQTAQELLRDTGASVTAVEVWQCATRVLVLDRHTAITPA